MANGKDMCVWVPFSNCLLPLQMSLWKTAVAVFGPNAVDVFCSLYISLSFEITGLLYINTNY